MGNIRDIAVGFFNSITDREDELYKQRISICRECPLYKNDSILGDICNPSLYVNQITGQTSTSYKEGYKNGCGCLLRAKTRVPEATCSLRKW